MSAAPSATVLIALAFAAVHVFGERLRFLRTVPRSRWLSAAGGVSVAYVFIHVLPELASHQKTVSEELTGGLLGAVERHVYLMALVGLSVFYGLDRMARTARHRDRERRPGRPPSVAVFRLHLRSYALYNVLIGYLLLHREEQDARGLVMYAVAMGLHFLVNDQGLREQHGALYDHSGRWLLAMAPLLGWGLGLAIDVPPLLVSTLFAFLAGGVVLNVLKEELPEDRESRFLAFAVGAAAYSGLLLTT